MYIEKQLTEQNYARVDFAATADQVSEAFNAFDELINIDLAYRQAGDYQIPGASNGRFGYFRRYAGVAEPGQSVPTETKHEYHFGANSRQALEANFMPWVPKTMREFCDHAEALYWLAVASLRQTLVDLRQESPSRFTRPTPGLQQEFLDPTRLLNIHLRFVGYEQPSGPDVPVARGHFDRSVFSLGLARTAPGFELGQEADGSDLRPVEYQDGSAIFFAGKGWAYMPPEYQAAYSFIKPAYHQVRNDGQLQATSGPIVQHGLVLFANAQHFATDPSKIETRPYRTEEMAAKPLARIPGAPSRVVPESANLLSA